MSAIRRALILVFFVVAAGCSEPATAPPAVELPLHLDEVTHVLTHRQQQPMGRPGVLPPLAQAAHHFGSPLSGAEEVPPVDTRARGNAVFRLNEDGSELHYRLVVANLVDVTQAHIHCGPAGSNGPVVLFLYPSEPPAVLIPGRTSGVLSERTATNDDIIARPDSDECPGGVASLEELIEKMRTGGAYVNAHTLEHPPGEIRGQIRGHGPS